MKILNYLFIFFVTVLVLMSLLALITIHLTLWDYSFSFSPEGLTTYIAAYGKYAALFAGTITVTSVYFGLLRVHAATEANRDKSRQDRFGEWKVVLEVRMAELKKDPFMKREFYRLRLQYFNELYQRNFIVANRQQLTEIFNVFAGHVAFFEQQNDEYIRMGSAVPNGIYSYSYDSFQFMFFGGIENMYNDIGNDLRQLYASRLPADRVINEENYHAAYRHRHNIM